MTTYLQSQFTIQTRTNFDFLQQPLDSESDEDKFLDPQAQQNIKDQKKQKKILDLEAVKNELSQRPPLDNQTNEFQYRKSQKSLNILNNPILPTSPILVEQLSQLKMIKNMRQEVPPELLGKIFSEFRYINVPQLTPVYRQGDQNKRFYIILEGKVIVMKPKEKMVGSSKFEIDDLKIAKQIKKIDTDPYGLRTTFPDYLILKVLFQGDGFGEAAIKLEVTRSSTVYTLENTHLLYMSEQAYMKLINPYMSKALDNKISYFGRTQLFHTIDPGDFMGIILECKLITKQAGDILYKEDEKTKHIYFIINGEIEIIKLLSDKSIILASYGEKQCFGEVEIIQKTLRTTSAKVITPKIQFYRIHKRQFFDNLGNYGVYEMMKQHVNIISQHWQKIIDQAQQIINPKDDVYQAAQDAIQNKPNFQAQNILNRKLVETSVSKLNQVKAFQNLTEEQLSHYRQSNPYNQNILQRVYSNTLQQYQAKLLKKPQQNQQSEGCIRKLYTNPNSTQQSQIIDTNIVTKENVIENGNFFQTARSSQLSVPRTENNSQILPTIHMKTSTSELNQVLQQVSKLPRVPRENLVLSLMYQQAYKSENPEKKAKQIQKIIQASHRNAQQMASGMRFGTKSVSQDLKPKKFQFSKYIVSPKRSNLVSFVYQKPINEIK